MRGVIRIKGLVNIFTGHGQGQGQIPGREPFGEADEIRHHPGLLKGKHRACPAKTSGHFIENQENIQLRSKGAQLL